MCLYLIQTYIYCDGTFKVAVSCQRDGNQGNHYQSTKKLKLVGFATEIKDGKKFWRNSSSTREREDWNAGNSADVFFWFAGKLYNFKAKEVSIVKSRKSNLISQTLSNLFMRQTTVNFFFFEKKLTLQIYNDS